MPIEGLHRIDAGIAGTALAVYDSASEAIFAAFTTPPTATRKGQIDAVVLALKAASIWTKIDAMWVLAAADSQAARINWKTPGTSTASEVNSPTFTADRGYTGNGTSSYLDTNFNPSTASQYTQNLCHAAGWSRTNVATASVSLFGNTGDTILLIPRTAGDQVSARINATATPLSVANTDGTGMWVVNRNTSTATQIFRNGASFGTGSVSSVAVSNLNWHLLRRNANYWAGQLAFAGIGNAFSSGEHTSYYNAMQTYMTAVGA